MQPATIHSSQPHRRQPAPAAVIDTHVHVFDPARFPYQEDRHYTPPAADFAALFRHLSALKIRNVVLVQPSIHGTDNACLLDALARGGPRCRGIAVIDLDRATAQDLSALHTAGVRGIRLNFAVQHENDPERACHELRRAATLIDRAGWCVQVHGSPRLLEAIESTLSTFRVPLVLDHLAGLQASTPLDAPALKTALRLLASGRVFLKLSAFYRASGDPTCADLRPLLHTLITARPDRLVWGSDWPHTGGTSGSGDRDPSRIEPFRTVDSRTSLAAIAQCTPDAATLRSILVDNAAQLYGFDPSFDPSPETP